MILAMFKTRLLRLDGIRSFTAVLEALLFCPHLLAQTNTSPRVVPEAEALYHLTQRVDPIYPPIAAAAHVEGDVRISVLLDAEGKVASERLLSGPPMLQQAALAALKRWQFTPYTANGAVQPVTTVLTVPFSLYRPLTSKQERAEQRWFPLSASCQDSLKIQNAVDSLDHCKLALDTSLEAGDLSSYDQMVRVESHEYYGRALLLAGKAREAVDQETLAIHEAKQCISENDVDYAKLHYWRAVANSKLGNIDVAEADFEAAEETYRGVIGNLPDRRQIYGQAFATVLRAHAALLDSLDRQADAEKLRAEAAAL